MLTKRMLKKAILPIDATASRRQFLKGSAAVGSALESELWCPVEDLQQAMKRQDLSLVAVTLSPGSCFSATPALSL